MFEQRLQYLKYLIFSKSSPIQYFYFYPFIQKEVDISLGYILQKS